MQCTLAASSAVQLPVATRQEEDWCCAPARGSSPSMAVTESSWPYRADAAVAAAEVSQVVVSVYELAEGSEKMQALYLRED
jgi:hypothetical protein